jgi:mannose-1-phosphate guanylyltransferase
VPPAFSPDLDLPCRVRADARSPANAAVYIFEPEIIGFLESLGKPIIDLITEVLSHYLGHICTYFNANYHRDIGSPESLRKAELEFPYS